MLCSEEREWSEKEVSQVDSSGNYGRQVIGFVVVVMIFVAINFYLMSLGIFSDIVPW